jgi:hypothetical protein
MVFIINILLQQIKNNALETTFFCTHLIIFLLKLCLWRLALVWKVGADAYLHMLFFAYSECRLVVATSLLSMLNMKDVQMSASKCKLTGSVATVLIM